jgi:hypothetical protein
MGSPFLSDNSMEISVRISDHDILQGYVFLFLECFTPCPRPTSTLEKIT